MNEEENLHSNIFKLIQERNITDEIQAMQFTF